MVSFSFALSPITCSSLRVAICLALCLCSSTLYGAPVENWKSRGDISSAWTSVRSGDWQQLELVGSRYRPRTSYGLGLHYERRSYQSVAFQDLTLFAPLSQQIGERTRLSTTLLGTIESDFSPLYQLALGLSHGLSSEITLGLDGRYGRWPSGWAAGLTPSLAYRQGSWLGIGRLISTIPEIGPIALTGELELQWKRSYWWQYTIRSHYGYEPLNDRLVPAELLSRQLGISVWFSRRLSDWDGLRLILSSIIFLERRELPFNSDRHQLALHYFRTF